MKTIYLIRHAKSSWKNIEISDFERPLNKRGKEDRKIMGQRLVSRNCNPQIFLSSSAKRTRETSIEISKAIGFKSSKIRFLDILYHAVHPVMLSEINKQNNKSDTLILVGHNPGISNLGYYLTGIPTSFPTCGIAKITFETNNWEEISSETGFLEFFDYPKSN